MSLENGLPKEVVTGEIDTDAKPIDQQDTLILGADTEVTGAPDMGGDNEAGLPAEGDEVSLANFEGNEVRGNGSALDRIKDATKRRKEKVGSKLRGTVGVLGRSAKMIGEVAQVVILAPDVAGKEALYAGGRGIKKGAEVTADVAVKGAKVAAKGATIAAGAAVFGVAATAYGGYRVGKFAVQKGGEAAMAGGRAVKKGAEAVGDVAVAAKVAVVEKALEKWNSATELATKAAEFCSDKYESAKDGFFSAINKLRRAMVEVQANALGAVEQKSAELRKKREERVKQLDALISLTDFFKKAEAPSVTDELDAYFAK